LLAGGLVGLLAVVPGPEPLVRAAWLPGLWMLFYGCALCAAGFFMQRGIQLFGWTFIGAGLAHTGVCLWSAAVSAGTGLWMGGVFGGLHLAYGLYLWRTEREHVEL
jgi:hypothetical protein